MPITSTEIVHHEIAAPSLGMSCLLANRIRNLTEERSKWFRDVFHSDKSWRSRTHQYVVITTDASAVVASIDAGVTMTPTVPDLSGAAFFTAKEADALVAAMGKEYRAAHMTSVGIIRCEMLLVAIEEAKDEFMAIAEAETQVMDRIAAENGDPFGYVVDDDGKVTITRESV